MLTSEEYDEIISQVDDPSIKEKDFAEYFLTMKAIIDIARDKMLVGPGRGSGRRDERRAHGRH